MQTIVAKTPEHPLSLAGTSAAAILTGAAEVFGNQQLPAIMCLVSAFFFYAFVLYIEYQKQPAKNERQRWLPKYRRIAFTSACLTGLILIMVIAWIRLSPKPVPAPPAAVRNPISNKEITATASGNDSVAISGGSGNVVNQNNDDKSAQDVDKIPPRKHRKSAP